MTGPITSVSGKVISRRIIESNVQTVMLRGISYHRRLLLAHDGTSIPLIKVFQSKDNYIPRSASGSAASASGSPEANGCASPQTTLQIVDASSNDISTERRSPHDAFMAVLSRFSRKRYKAIALTVASCIALPIGVFDASLPSLVSHVSTVWNQISNNYVFVVGFWGWFLAQFFKIFTKWYKTGIFSPSAFFDSGGMPSSHSSLCSAMTMAVALKHGLGSSLFAACTCFTVIVMYDAMGVRRHAGLQAQVLNAVVNDLLEGHPVSERKLKEVLGHTPRQVLCGGILGILVGLLFPH